MSSWMKTGWKFLYYLECPKIFLTNLNILWNWYILAKELHLIFFEEEIFVWHSSLILPKKLAFSRNRDLLNLQNLNLLRYKKILVDKHAVLKDHLTFKVHFHRDQYFINWGFQKFFLSFIKCSKYKYLIFPNYPIYK